MLTGMVPTFAARVGVVALLVFGSSSPAEAQRDYAQFNASRGAELSLFGGAAAGTSGASPSFGWSLGWRPATWVVIEGSGTWMSEPGTDGFAAVFGPRFYLNTTGRTSPFLTAEAGLYHASVNSTDPDASDFYRDRMLPGSPEKAFNDFVAAGGGGLDVHLSGRIWARPAARVLMVVDGWRTHTMFVAGVHLSYSFTRISSP
jgi:hypothetical protein